METQQTLSMFNLRESLSLASHSGGGGGSSSAHAPSSSTPAACGSDRDEGPEAVGAVAFSLVNPWAVYAAVGTVACMVDTRTPVSHPGGTGGTVGAACGTAGQGVVQTYRFCKDDVGHLAVNAKGQYIALGDDSGAIQVGAVCPGAVRAVGSEKWWEWWWWNRSRDTSTAVC